MIGKILRRLAGLFRSWGDSGTYVVPAVEYVRQEPLPANPLFDDEEELRRCLALTAETLRSRT